MRKAKRRTASVVTVALLVVIGTVTLGLGPAGAGVCDLPPNEVYLCCQDETQCGGYSFCQQQAIGYCHAFSVEWFPYPEFYYRLCQNDAECSPEYGNWCLVHGQCEGSGEHCVIGASNPYCCYGGGGGQWGYITCDDNHPCPECCAVGRCESGVCSVGGSGACAPGEQCLPCTCVDNDGDGYGAPPVSPACSHPEADCDDSNPDVHPGAVEECGGTTCSDGLDNDCNGPADSQDPACKQWCPNQVQGSTVDATRTGGLAPVALFATLMLPAATILAWKGLKRRG